MKQSLKSLVTLSVVGIISMTAVCAEEKHPRQMVVAQTSDKADSGWIQLFNGKDLTGWTPKFQGEDLGVNFKNTFLVKGCGKVVHEYHDPQLDDGSLLKKGTISIQAESHPIQFRKIELKVLK